MNFSHPLSSELQQKEEKTRESARKGRKSVFLSDVLGLAVRRELLVRLLHSSAAMTASEQIFFFGRGKKTQIAA